MIIWLHIILLAIKAVCRSIQGCAGRACIGICIWKQLFAVSWEASLFCKIRWGSSLLVRCQVCLLTYSKSDWKMGYCITKCDDVWCFDICTRYVCFRFWMYVTRYPIRNRIGEHADLASDQKIRSSADLQNWQLNWRHFIVYMRSINDVCFLMHWSRSVFFVNYRSVFLVNKYTELSFTKKCVAKILC